MKLKSCLSIAFWFSALNVCIGQTFDYRITNYNTENGLPQNSVKDIKIDKAGYCWLSTEMGLVRYDGRSFQIFTSSDIEGLNTDRIQSLFYTTDGTLLAKGENRQIIEIHKLSQHEAPIPRVNKNQSIIPIHAGYAIYKKSTDQLIKELGKKNHSVNFSYIYTTDHGVYVTVKNHLFYIANEKISVVDTIHAKEYERTTLVEDMVIAIQAKRKLIAWHKGRLLPNITKIEGDIMEESGIQENLLRVTWGSEGTYLYTGKNIYRLYIKNGLIYSETVIKNIEIQGFSAIHYLKKENKYLIGSNTHGLFIVQPSVFDYPFVPDYQYDNSFYTQLKLNEQELLTRNLYYNSSSSLPKIYPLNIKPNRAAFMDKSGFIYTDVDYNLCKYNIKTKRNDSIIILDSRLRAIFPDHKTDNIYFITRYFFGTLKKSNTVMMKKLPDSISVTTGLQLDEDLFLLGTNQGLKWYNYSTNTFSHHILDSINIWSLHKDNNNRIWIGSYGKGFFLYNKRKLSAFPFGPRNSLKTVHSFIDDGRGNFWLPTNNGLFKVAHSALLAYAAGNTEDVYFYMYHKDDGLRSNEFNGGCTPSYIWFGDSILSLPSINGLVWFYPQKTSPVFASNNIYIDNLILNGNKASLNTIAKLQPGSHLLEITVSCPYYGNKENLSIDYRIEGTGSSWQKLNEDNRVIIQNLPSGNYNLVFRKVEENNHSKYYYLKVPILIDPFFYNTWWFYSLLILTLISGLYFFTQWRTKKLKIRAHSLEQKIQERTDELSKTVFELTQSKLQLQESNIMKDRMVSMVLHDLRSPLRFLEMLSTRLAKNHKVLTEQSVSERLAEIKNSASSIYGYTNQFLTWTSTQNGLYKLRIENVDLNTIFLNIQELYLEIARYQKNTLTITPTTLMCKTDPELLTAILRNLVDNSIKYTYNGNIHMLANMSEENIYICVTDTGTGMSQELIDTFAGNKEATNAGIGSTLIQDLLNKIGGSLFLESEVGKGTIFTIQLPRYFQQDHIIEPFG